MDNGQLIAEVGVAPAEPLEFIVLRLARDADGTLTLKEK
jgi:phage tail sheath protein FI